MEATTVFKDTEVIYSLLRIVLLFYRNMVEDLETYVIEMNP